MPTTTGPAPTPRPQRTPRKVPIPDYERAVLRVFRHPLRLDSSRRARFFLSFANALLELDGYLQTEDRTVNETLVEVFDSLLRQSGTIPSTPVALVNYLHVVLDHLSYLAATSRPEAGPGAWASIPIAPNSATIPCMLHVDTMRYYRWLSGRLEGLGHVVELGCWLGGSTFLLAEGLAGNASFRSRKLFAYDSFIWRKWMDRFVDTRPDGSPVRLPRTSFLPLFRRFCAPHAELIEPVVCEISAGRHRHTRPAWAGDPIELLVYDMGASLTQLREMWRVFSPFFIPAKTIVVFNEYGQARSEHIWRFQREHSMQLSAIHKPVSSAKSFVFQP